MPAETTAIILNRGKELLGGAASGFSRFAAHSFNLGSTAGYTPVATDTNVRGSIVYTGHAGLVQSRMVDRDTVTFTMLVPEGVGPFSFGSVVLFGNAFDGSPLPFIEIAFPYTIDKVIADPNIGAGTPFPKPGSRLMISVTFKISTASAGTAVTVSVVAPQFNNLPSFEDEMSLPPPLAQPWNQFIVQRHTVLKNPVLATKRADASQWGMPLFDNLRSPRFGFIDGGVMGDKYQAEGCNWLFGQRYDTPAEYFQGQVGGASYTTLVAIPEENTLGAVPY